MPISDSLRIVPFQPADQAAVKALILAGLAEHWGWLDPTKNPDLDDIAANYAYATFLVAWMSERIVGTGALIRRTPTVAEIVRMSVAADLRRYGIGRAIVQHLCAHAQQSGFRRIMLETTATWHEVVTFYTTLDFHITHTQDGDVYFALELAKQQD